MDVYAQDPATSPEIVQFTGVVLGDDGQTQVPGVHVYVPKAGRGTTTNVYGYFSMPALVGDSVIISSIGYIKQSFIVPDSESSRVNVIFKLSTDITYLENIDITPFLSEEMFKEAILAMKLPEEQSIISNGVNSGPSWAEMVANTPIDASTNARYYFDQQYYYMQDSYGPRSNPFLNPFNWAKFIKTLKKK